VWWDINDRFLVNFLPDKPDKAFCENQPIIEVMARIMRLDLQLGM